MLIPEDDFPLHQVAKPLAHTMDGHPNGYDRFWFNGYGDDFYFAAALGLYPNRGVIDAAFSLSLGGTQRSVFACDTLNGRPTRVGPISIEIIEPLRTNRLVVNDPEHGVHADLIYRRRSAAIEEPRQTLHDGPRIFLDVSRATQLGEWEGVIETPEGTVEVAPGTYGTKDRSWGVRPLGEPVPGAPGVREPQFCFLWAPINFPERAVHFMSIDDSDGRPLSRTALELPLEGHGEPIARRGSLDLDPEPGTRRMASVRLHLDDEAIELTPIRTFHMRGAGYGHPNFAHGRFHGGPYCETEILQLSDLDPLDYHNLHIQQVVRGTFRGSEGLGVVESLIIGPYAPARLTGLLDGFIAPSL